MHAHVFVSACIYVCWSVRCTVCYICVHACTRTCRFTIPVVDVVRLLLPDFVVLVPAVAALGVNSRILRAYKKGEEALVVRERERLEGALTEEGVGTKEVITLQEQPKCMFIRAMSNNSN